jgi:hypothetical protein
VESTDLTIRENFQSAMVSGKDNGKISVHFDFSTPDEGDDLFSEPLPPSLSTSYETYDKHPLKLRKINCQPEDAVSPLSQSSKATSQYSSILAKSEINSPSYKVVCLNTEHRNNIKIEELELLEVLGAKMLQKEESAINTLNIETMDENEEDDCPTSPLDDRATTKGQQFHTDSILSKSTKSSSFETAHSNKKSTFHSMKKVASKAFRFGGLLKRSGAHKLMSSTHEKLS